MLFRTRINPVTLWKEGVAGFSYLLWLVDFVRVKSLGKGHVDFVRVKRVGKGLVDFGSVKRVGDRVGFYLKRF